MNAVLHEHKGIIGFMPWQGYIYENEYCYWQVDHVADANFIY